jgi:protocatechuate 3,4-dioxygenase beta subunit
METMARAKMCLLLCVVCANIFAQPAGQGVISGTVVEASNGEAVRKAVVTVTWHGTPRAWATTRTDGSGRFTFEGLPAGNYDLRAVKQGLGTAIYGADSIRELGDVITLAEGETRANLKLRFLRSATISGRVADTDGDPISGATVTLLHPGRNLGERVLTNSQSASTNDRGEYKITADPGEYYLRCVPNTQRQMRQVHVEMAVPQYFGGGRDSKDATPVYLRGGDALSGIDFRLTMEGPATITGHLTGVPPMDPPTEQVAGGPDPRVNNMRNRRFNSEGGQTVMVEMSTADDNQNLFGSRGTGSQAPDYRFEMPENVPGRYRIQATVRAKDKTYYASQIIDAHEGANEIVLAMAPTVGVRGHLKVEGPGQHAVEGYTVMLAPRGMGPRAGTYSSPVKKDGSFVIEDVPPGEWLLNFNPSEAGLFEKSVLLGDKEFLYKLLEIPPGSDAPLSIVLSSNTGIVSGEIDAGDTGGGAKRAGILLEPIGKWHTLARFYYSALADDKGKFKVNGVAPGEYKIFALERIATGSFRTVESAELLEAALKDQAEELEVTEGAKVEAHPKLIPEDKAKEILKP